MLRLFRFPPPPPVSFDLFELVVVWSAVFYTTQRRVFCICILSRIHCRWWSTRARLCHFLGLSYKHLSSLLSYSHPYCLTLILTVFLSSLLSFSHLYCLSLILTVLLSSLLSYSHPYCLSLKWVPVGSPSRGGDVTLYVWHKPTKLAHSFFYSVLASISDFMAHSTIFHSINSPDKSPFSDSVLPVLSLPYWSFQLYISLWKFPSALI